MILSGLVPRVAVTRPPRYCSTPISSRRCCGRRTVRKGHLRRAAGRRPTSTFRRTLWRTGPADRTRTCADP